MSTVIKIKLSVLLLLLAGCAVTPKKIDEALAKSPMHEELDANWVIALSPSTTSDFIDVVPRSYGGDDGIWVHGGSTGVRWFVPELGAGGLTRDELFAQATEGSVALQVAGAKWLNKEKVFWYGQEAIDYTAIGIGEILKIILGANPLTQ